MTELPMLEAEAWDSRLQERYSTFQAEYWEFIADLREGSEQSYPQLLGFTDIRQFIEARFSGSTATIYRRMSEFKKLQPISIEDLKLIPEGNAYQLTRLPEKMRTSNGWLRDARINPTSHFKRMVDTVLAENGVPAEDRTVLVCFRMPEPLFEKCQEVYAKLCRILDENPDVSRNVIIEAVVATLLSEDEASLKASITGDVDRDAQATPRR
ncbi:MAG: hypothetical protein WAM96_06890 [Candidatus Acidiferrales bacterium]|jgi:hypothetical protein